MNVVHVVRSAWPRVGGLEASVGGLAAAQRAAGHDVTVISLGTGTELGVVDRDGVCYRTLARVGPRRYPTALRLPSLVRAADVVHVHGLDGLLDVLVAARPGPPIGVSTHGGYFHTARHRRLKSVWLRTITRWSLSQAHAVWFTSEADRAVLAGAGAEGLVLPDGVDVARFRSVERRPRSGHWIVVGRVDAHKGLDDLIEVLGALRRLGHAVRVDVVGPTPDARLVTRLARQAEQAGLGSSLAFVGSASGDALLEHLARAELALFPSRYEGFGIAAVEAMAAGVPTALSAIPAFRTHADYATTVDFTQPLAAAQTLAAWAPDADSTARARAAVEAFSWPERLLAWNAAYDAIAGR